MPPFCLTSYQKADNALSYERVAPTWQQSSRFNFHFIATYLGDNTAEVELGDGTIFTVRLDTGTVQYPE